MLTAKQKTMIRKIWRKSPIRTEDALARRMEEAACIARLAENGMIAIVYGGVDCDGSRWDDEVELVPATMTHVRHWIDGYHEDAEGPQWAHVERPSLAAKLTASSRDLALEAFEDGHPHVLYA